MTTPRMSVVLVTLDRYAPLRKTVSCLAAQTRSGELELVIVSPSELPDAEDDQWSRFQGVKLVGIGPISNPGQARARATAECTAAVVSFAEDHCFPEPEWAETLMRFHDEGWAAVCPSLGNGNPGAVSWADMILNHGSCVHPVAAGSVLQAPWHNTSYRRDLLVEYGEGLADLLDAEVRLHDDLVRRGFRIYLAGQVKSDHVNLSLWRSFLHCQMAGGQLYGAARAGGWSGPKRWLRAASLPLIPLVRAPKLLVSARRTMRNGLSLPFLLACAAGAAASAVGEVSGYVLGAGRAAEARLPYEFDRAHHVRPEERYLLA